MAKRRWRAQDIPTRREIAETVARVNWRPRWRTIVYTGLGPFEPDYKAWQATPDLPSPPCVTCGAEAICSDSVCGACGTPHGQRPIEQQRTRADVEALLARTRVEAMMARRRMVASYLGGTPAQAIADREGVSRGRIRKVLIEDGVWMKPNRRRRR